MKKINLEEILLNQAKGLDKVFPEYVEDCKLAMLEFGKRLLRLTSKRVDYTIEKSEEEIYIGLAQEINNSILDTINQIE